MSMKDNNWNNWKKDKRNSIKNERISMIWCKKNFFMMKYIIIYFVLFYDKIKFFAFFENFSNVKSIKKI